MVKLKTATLKASTLMEAIVAMVIVMVIFSIAMQVFNNVFATGVSLKKIQVQNQLNVLEKAVKRTGIIAQEQLQVDSVDYVLSGTSAQIPGLNQLEIKATLHGKLLGELHGLYKTKSNEAEN